MKPTWMGQRRAISDCWGGSKCESCVWATLYLALLDRCCVFVAHGTDLHSSLPLSVTLVKELLHNAISPLAIQLQGLGGVTQVSAVHHVTQHLEMIHNCCYWTSLWKKNINSLIKYTLHKTNLFSSMFFEMFKLLMIAALLPQCSRTSPVSSTEATVL